MARKRKAKKDRHITLHMTVPPKLAARIDSMLDDLRSQLPYRHVSRSDFVSYIIGEWFSLIDNIDNAPTSRADIRRRVRKSNLKNSHYGVNGNAVLSPEKVRAIRRDKRLQKEIAREVGVHNSTISRIKNRSIWGWVS